MSKSATKIETLAADLAKIGGELASTDERIRSIRAEIKRFNDAVDSGKLASLPASWSYRAAVDDLDKLLPLRHELNTKYTAVDAEYKRLKQEETDRQLKELQLKHQEALIRLLRAGIALAAAGDEVFDLGDRAALLADRHSCPFPSAGPARGAWSVGNILNTPLGFWLKESREAGLISGRESWLAGIKF